MKQEKRFLFWVGLTSLLGIASGFLPPGYSSAARGQPTILRASREDKSGAVYPPIVAIVGPPGSGQTTFARYATWLSVQNANLSHSHVGFYAIFAQCAGRGIWTHSNLYHGEGHAG
jgi:hypothetical protein